MGGPSRLLQRARPALAPLRGERVAVAVSGGMDSVVLLDLLFELRGQLQLELVVAHVDHGLRGRESAEDARFVRHLAASLGLPCYCGRLLAPQGRGLEDGARRERRAFLRGVPAAAVALAHHRDDQAETVLLRALRASALETLGMEAWRPPFLRPLLEAPREELRAWASQRGLRWRQDASNEDLCRERNLIRAQALPLLDRVHGGVRERLVALAREAAQEVRATSIDPGGRGLHGPNPLELEALGQLPPALQRRALRGLLDRWMGPGHGASREHFDRCLALASRPRPGAWVPLPSGWRAAVCARRLYCLPPPPRPVEIRLPGVRRWGVHDLLVERPDQRRDAILLRPPREGERFDGQPLRERLRCGGVPAPLRPYHPVFERHGTVLWVPGVGRRGGSEAAGGLAIGLRASIPGAYGPGRPWAATL